MRGMYVIAGLALVLALVAVGYEERPPPMPEPAASKQLCDAFHAWKAAAHDTSPGMDRLCK